MRTPQEISLRKQKVVEKINKYNYGENMYHYTSMASLIGILSNKELWMGNTANMNDKSELKDFVVKMQMAVSNEIYPEKIDSYNSFFEELYNRLKNEYPFAACFSELNDNAAQWERYANNAHGVCIVFNTSALMNLFHYSGALFRKVIYKYNIKDHKHYKILKDYFNTGVLNELEDVKGEMDNLLACAYLHKHESFFTESEIRLTNLWREKIQESKFSFEMVNGKIIKVLKVSLENLCANESIDFEELIEGIIIGPRSEQNIHELKEYIESLGYKGLSEKVTISQCPLR